MPRGLTIAGQVVLLAPRATYLKRCILHLGYGFFYDTGFQTREGLRGMSY